MYASTRFQTKMIVQMYEYYELFYDSEGIKHIPENIHQILTLQALSIWYMDDGCIEFSHQKNNKRGTINQRHRINFHTNCFTFKQQNILSDAIFKNFGIRFHIKKVNKGKHYILHIRSRTDIQKFCKIIQPYIIQSMKYKIQLKYTKKKKFFMSPQRIKRIYKYLNIKARKDVLKYRKGKQLNLSANCFFKGKLDQLYCK